MPIAMKRILDVYCKLTILHARPCPIICFRCCPSWNNFSSDYCLVIQFVVWKNLWRDGMQIYMSLKFNQIIVSEMHCNQTMKFKQAPRVEFRYYENMLIRLYAACMNKSREGVLFMHKRTPVSHNWATPVMQSSKSRAVHLKMSNAIVIIHLVHDDSFLGYQTEWITQS